MRIEDYRHPVQFIVTQYWTSNYYLKTMTSRQRFDESIEQYLASCLRTFEHTFPDFNYRNFKYWIATDNSISSAQAMFTYAIPHDEWDHEYDMLTTCQGWPSEIREMEYA